MENLNAKIGNCDNSLKSMEMEVDILRKAYELILENSNIFYDELSKAFTNALENPDLTPLTGKTF